MTPVFVISEFSNCCYTGIKKDKCVKTSFLSLHQPGLSSQCFNKGQCNFNAYYEKNHRLQKRFRRKIKKYARDDQNI